MITITAKFMLLPTEIGGRMLPIFPGYRPNWSTKGLGEVITCGSIYHIFDQESLKPGEIGLIDIIPLVEENWSHLKKGDTLRAYEGSKLVGAALIEKIEGA